MNEENIKSLVLEFQKDSKKIDYENLKKKKSTEKQDKLDKNLQLKYYFILIYYEILPQSKLLRNFNNIKNIQI